MQYAVGIDEVGRGPVAGPVTVCALQWLSQESPDHILAGIRDSKKLTPRARTLWFEQAKQLKTTVRFSVYSSEAAAIDTDGIIKALAAAATKTLEELDQQQKVQHVYADYSLPVPAHYAQSHHVKGDETNPLITFASIIAKVMRDAVMCQHDRHFPHYAFAKNKGYGTKEHRTALQKHGMTPIHRKTFLKQWDTGPKR